MYRYFTYVIYNEFYKTQFWIEHVLFCTTRCKQSFVSNLVLEEILITVCNFLFFLGNVWIQYIPQVRFLLRSNISYRSDSCSDPIYPTGQIPAQIQYILQVRFLLISTYDLWLHFWYLQTFPLSDPWLMTIVLSLVWPDQDWLKPWSTILEANTPTMTPWGGLLILILLLASISLVVENKKYIFSWHVL
jgi:hypothetical protein